MLVPDMSSSHESMLLFPGVETIFCLLRIQSALQARLVIFAFKVTVTDIQVLAKTRTL